MIKTHRFFLITWTLVFWISSNRFFTNGISHIYWLSIFTPLLLIAVYLALCNRDFYFGKKGILLWVSFFSLSLLVFVTGFFSAEYEWPLKKGLVWFVTILSLFLMQSFFNNTQNIRLIIKVLLVLSFLYLIFITYKYYNFAGVNFVQNGMNKAMSVEIFFVGFISFVYLSKPKYFTSIFILPMFVVIILLTMSLKLLASLLPLILLFIFKNPRNSVIFIVLMTLMHLNLDFDILNQPLFDRFIYTLGWESTSYASNDIDSNLSLRSNIYYMDYFSLLFGNGLENERLIIGTMFHSTFLSLLYGTGIIGVFLFYLPFVGSVKKYIISGGCGSFNDVTILASIFIFSLVSPLYSSPLLILFLVITFNLINNSTYAYPDRYKQIN
jgi:hypothetical protein